MLLDNRERVSGVCLVGGRREEGRREEWVRALMCGVDKGSWKKLGVDLEGHAMTLGSWFDVKGPHLLLVLLPR